MDLGQYYNKNLIPLKSIIAHACKLSSPSENVVSRILGQNPDTDGKVISKGTVISAFRYLKSIGLLHVSKKMEARFMDNMKMKRIRTLSGVTTVTVLTKPYPCPGKCIFCPTDTSMPKSYIASEPGAQRALANNFDPYLQTFNRLVALRNIGHSTDKVELIILGGTWTAYPTEYRLWFVTRCFNALNDFGSNVEFERIDSCKLNKAKPQKNISSWKDLKKSQEMNIYSHCKCVGISVETRPDELSQATVKEIRKLGATKVQIGVQTLNNRVLTMNARNNSLKQIRTAFKLLRHAGFKIQAHWMPNLFGATIKTDLQNYIKLFTKDYSPDEVKIYPCSLIANTPLEKLYRQGTWRPYNENELLNLLTKMVVLTPNYCRISRIVRDIPSQDIMVGNMKTNFRQLVDENIKKNKLMLMEIRSREIGNDHVSPKDLIMKETVYPTSSSKEYFLEFVTQYNQIAGFLRLSLPKSAPYILELKNAAIIREVHVYGQSLPIGIVTKGKAQHSGLGSLLIAKAQEIARNNGYAKLAVISAIGTISYYEKFGFNRGDMYQLLDNNVHKPANNRKNDTE